MPLLRRKFSESARPYKIWLYPLPDVVALAGWIAAFPLSGTRYVLFGLLTLLTGLTVFSRARWTRNSPFAPVRQSPTPAP